MGTYGHIVMDRLSKRYTVDGAPLEVLRDLTLDIASGEFVVVVGASGCGKSTLLRLIAGLEREHDGTLAQDGAPITGPGLDRGLVFQEHRLFPWLSVEGNVRAALLNADVPRAEQAERVRRHIELVGLAGFERAWPHQLSGGMAQRVAIARALVNRPRVLLLDEPFGALDALTRARLQRELLDIWRTQRITAVLVTHDVDEAVFLADRIVVLESRPGRIRRILPVNLAHPRDRTAAEFGALKRAVLAELGEAATGHAPAVEPARAQGPAVEPTMH
ncbi:MAG: ABC transporter ATP-binding protein [Burkholderiales bacterium]|jgi:ABC-type nitrate/sulfonate/bicarbonate transport system ATPase subunit